MNGLYQLTVATCALTLRPCGGWRGSDSDRTGVLPEVCSLKGQNLSRVNLSTGNPTRVGNFVSDFFLQEMAFQLEIQMQTLYLPESLY